MSDQHILSSNELPGAPGVKIIRSGKADAWQDGYRFLEETKEVYAAERKRGYEDGMAGAKHDAAKLVAETTEKVNRHMASLEKKVAQLAFDIVRRVISEFDDAELVARAASNALVDFRDGNTVRIKVHPSAEASVKAMIEARMREADHEALTITIETDDELDKKACILSTEFAVIEATIETQLAAIAEVMGINPAKLKMAQA